MVIYHIVTPENWEKQKNEAEYESESLHSEGFIHCSYENQLEAVLERYYKGTEKVLILMIDQSLLTSKLVAEPSTGGEIYPHIYGKINRAAIIDINEKQLS